MSLSTMTEWALRGAASGSAVGWRPGPHGVSRRGKGGTVDVVVDEGLTIPAAELRFTTARSSGPGGQNVNKVESRVTLLFPVLDSRVLAPEQRERILEQLATRIGKDGVLRVSSQRHRTQAANRRQAAERLGELLRDALAEEPERRPTRVPPRARRRRLKEKRHRSEIKRLRGGTPDD